MVYTASGIQLSISITLPVDQYSEDVWYFSELPYRTIGSVMDVGSSGRSYRRVRFAPLHERETMVLKGQYDEGNRRIMVGEDLSNFGQHTILQSIYLDSLNTFRLMYDNSRVNYFLARIVSIELSHRESNTIVESNIYLSNTSRMLRVSEHGNTLLYSTVYTDNEDETTYRIGTTITVEFTMSRASPANFVTFFHRFLLVADVIGEFMYKVSYTVMELHLDAHFIFVILIVGSDDGEDHTYRHTTDGSVVNYSP